MLNYQPKTNTDNNGDKNVHFFIMVRLQFYFLLLFPPNLLVFLLFAITAAGVVPCGGPLMSLTAFRHASLI